LPEEFSRQSRLCASRQKVALGRLGFLVGFLAIFAAGCAHHPHAAPPSSQVPSPKPGNPPNQPQPSGPPPAVEKQPAIPGVYMEEGEASWYGVPFNGHRTSNGEIYDMHQMTAAHRTLPFGTLVRVTNLSNGKQTQVRINDRGPFVANRVIDLSLAAARAIEMVGPGIAPVRLEIVSGENPAEGMFGVQVGAFRMQENAEKLRAQLAATYSPVEIVTYDSPNGLYYRVRVGRLPDEDAANQLADQLRENENLTTFVVRLDD